MAEVVAKEAAEVAEEAKEGAEVAEEEEVGLHRPASTLGLPTLTLVEEGTEVEARLRLLPAPARRVVAAAAPSKPTLFSRRFKDQKRKKNKAASLRRRNATPTNAK